MCIEGIPFTVRGKSRESYSWKWTSLIKRGFSINIWCTYVHTSTLSSCTRGTLSPSSASSRHISRFALLHYRAIRSALRPSCVFASLCFLRREEPVFSERPIHREDLEENGEERRDLSTTRLQRRRMRGSSIRSVCSNFALHIK